MHHLPTFARAALLAALLAACGGGDDEPVLRLSFGGVVGGNNCFSGQPETLTVRFDLTLSGRTAGNAVTVSDVQGAVWQGQVLDAGGIEVRRTAADERFVIRAGDVFGSSPRFDVTASCVSFRCCTTLSGTLAPV